MKINDLFILGFFDIKIQVILLKMHLTKTIFLINKININSINSVFYYFLLFAIKKIIFFLTFCCKNQFSN